MGTVVYVYVVWTLVICGSMSRCSVADAVYGRGADCGQGGIPPSVQLLTSNTQCTMNLCTKECCMPQSHIYPIPISTTDKHMSTSLACTSSTVVVWQYQWLLDWCFVSNHNCMDYYIMQFQSEHYTYWLIVFYQLCNNIVH